MARASGAILLDESIKDIHKIRAIADEIEQATQGLDCEIALQSVPFSLPCLC